jgi:tRNA A-37 threonylcarbamoyl transferase component Bud32
LAICAHCSTPVADEAKFCHSCGSLVSDAEGQAAATASLDRSAFDHMEKLLREETKGVYTVGHLLGRGGMAVVYLATEVGLSRKVALKVLPPELTFGHGVERFKREARTAAALDHPHIIPIYRISDSGKLFWYAMKYLEGRSLEDLLRERGSFSVEETVEVLEQVADALDYAHEHKVIHRDMKPANVMLDNRNRVIVTDFGIAKALSEGKLTATDSVIGTPYFMSPEQGMGKTVSGASDQYSVAVMAYRMLAGHVPFDGDSAIDILHKHCMFPPPSLAEAAPHLPEHVVAAVERGLAKAGTERFGSVHDFVQAMKDPDFMEKPAARGSVATVVLTAEEAKAMRSAGAAKSGGSTGPAAKTVAAKPAAKSAPAAAPASKGKPAAAAAAPVPEKKSKAGLIAAAAIVILAGGGIGAWQMSKGGTETQAPPANALVNQPAGGTSTPTTPPGTAQNPAAPTGTGTPPVQVADGGATKTPDPAVAAPPAAEPKAPVTRTPPRNATTRPNTTTRPANTPATTPASTPANNPAQQPAGANSAPATQPAATPPAPAGNTGAAPAGGGLGDRGILQIRMTPPAIVSVNLVARPQRSALVDTLPVGTHAVRVEREGYVTRDTTFTIKAGETARWIVTLQARTP